MSEQEKMVIVNRLLSEIKQQGSREWQVMYEHITCLESDVEEKDREIHKLKKDIQDLNDDIAENYRPIPRAEQYDMADCNFH